MGTISIILAMMAAVIVSAIIVRMLPLAVPTPLVQIALGASIAMASGHAVRLAPDIFFLLFLPPLLFLDGWRIPKEGLLRDKGVILELALGLVVFTVLGMGFLIHWMIPAMPLSVSFALAAIVSPTDPIAVSAITARAPMPKRVMHVLEGESLLNDASGLVCFRVAVAAAVTGTFSLSAAAGHFLQLAIGGVLAGVVSTFVIMRVKNRVSARFGEESGSHVLLSLLVPFVAYQLAEHLDCSGILAAVAAGITMSYQELAGEMLGATRMQRAAVWDTLQFALNGVMFVLLGEQLPGILSGAVDAVQESNHENPWWLVVYVIAINFGLAALRFIWVWASVHFSAFVSQLRGQHGAPKPTLRLITAVSVAGARGAITLAGVLTLPLAIAGDEAFPARNLTIFLAAGVIIMSLMAAGIFLPRLARSFDMSAEPSEQDEAEVARVLAAKAAIRAVEQTQHELAADQNDADVYAEAAARVMDHYRRRVDGGTQTGESAARMRRGNEIERSLRLAAVRAERDVIFALGRSQRISDVSARRLVREVDLVEERLR